MSKAIQVRRFSLFEKELDAEDEEITHTRKVRRIAILEKYRKHIEALLSGEDIDSHDST